MVNPWIKQHLAFVAMVVGGTDSADDLARVGNDVVGAPRLMSVLCSVTRHCEPVFGRSNLSGERHDRSVVPSEEVATSLVESVLAMTGAGFPYGRAPGR